MPGLLDSTPASPLVQQYNRMKPTEPAAPAAPKPAQPERPAPTPATPEPKPAQAERPAGPNNFESALKNVGDIERRKSEIQQPQFRAPPKPKNVQEGINMWGALAIAFAGLASLRTRTPMTAALNAAGSVMEAIKQGNLQQLEDSYKQWQENNKTAHEVFQSEQDAYKDIMSRMDHREELLLRAGQALDTEKYREGQAQLHALMNTMRDAPALEVYNKAGGGAAGVEAVAKLKKQQAEQAQFMKQLDVLAKSKNAQAMATVMAYQNSPEAKKLIAAGRQDLVNQNSLQIIAHMNPEAVNDLPGMPNKDQLEWAAKKIANYELDMKQYLANFSGRGKEALRAIVANRLQDAVTKINPDYAPSNYPIVQGINKDFATGKLGNAAASLTMLKGHLELMEHFAKQLPSNTDFTTANSFINMVARMTGDPNITSYEAAANAVKVELTKVLNGTGAGTQAERDEAGAQISAAHTPAQLQASISTIKQLVESRVVANVNRVAPWVKPGRFMAPDVLKFWGFDAGGGRTEESKTKAPEAAPSALPKDAIEDKRHPGLFFTPNGDWFRKDGTPVK